MYDIISIGDTVQDVYLEMSPENTHLHTLNDTTQEISFTFGTKIPVTSKHDAIGGNAANAAIAFARLGFRTAIYTHVGGDGTGTRIINEFTQNGVSTDYIVTDEGKESNYNTIINLNGERTILIYHAHRHFALPRLLKASWVYLTSMSKGFEVIFDDLIGYLDATGAKLCFQPGTFQLNFGAEKTAKILKRADIFGLNKEEAELYLGKPTGTPIRELLDAALALGPKLVVISDGPKGAYCSDGKEYLYLGIIKDAPRKEATGAGDSFVAGFMAATTDGKTPAEALRWGQAESSSVIQFVGPQAGLLSHLELTQLLEKYPDLQAVPLDSLEN